MKKLLFALVAIISLITITGCGKDDAPNYSKMIGYYVLTSTTASEQAVDGYEGSLEVKEGQVAVITINDRTAPLTIDGYYFINETDNKLKYTFENGVIKIEDSENEVIITFEKQK